MSLWNIIKFYEFYINTQVKNPLYHSLGPSDWGWLGSSYPRYQRSDNMERLQVCGHVAKHSFRDQGLYSFYMSFVPTLSSNVKVFSWFDSQLLTTDDLLTNVHISLFWVLEFHWNICRADSGTWGPCSHWMVGFCRRSALQNSWKWCTTT